MQIWLPHFLKGGRISKTRERPPLTNLIKGVNKNIWGEILI
jgi:hypothetical protein